MSGSENSCECGANLARLLGGKVAVKTLPITKDYLDERRWMTEKGEMAQVANSADEAFRHLMYWDLKPDGANAIRGQHYHKRKVENLYLLAGRVELSVQDLQSQQTTSVILAAGTKVSIAPECAHAYRALEYSQALEFHAERYDESDTFRFDVPERDKQLR